MSCCDHTDDEIAQNFNPAKYFTLLALALALWIGAYITIEPLSIWIVQDLLNLDTSQPLGKSVEFFLFDTAKILLLLVIMLYVLGWMRAGLNTEWLRSYLSNKSRFLSYSIAAGFGAITPFCSCSGVPLFIAFTRAKIPIGTSMAFLITSPMINEVAVILLWGLLGWKFTLIYVSVGLSVGIIGGFVMDTIRAERWLLPMMTEPNCVQKHDHDSAESPANYSTGLAERHAFAKEETLSITRGIWLWVVAGVGLGAILHGYVPQDWFNEYLGQGQWWSVPLAVMAGIPLYVNCVGVIPIMESLLAKGMPVGTTLAFCMSILAASLPEFIILKQVMKAKLLIAFVLTLLAIFTVVGWLFNAVQDYII